jgi:hypothetical protein
MPTTCEIAGLSPGLLEADGRSMLSRLGADAYYGLAQRMLVTGLRRRGTGDESRRL